MEIIDAPSPNHDERGRSVDTVILHYTGMQSASAALDRLRDPEARVSAHYLIDEAGRVFALVPEDRRAWHAGVSSWLGETDINARSVGVELANPGHEWGYTPFPDAQISALETLLAAALARHGVPPRRVLGHSDVAPQRKEDPGERFPWARLAAKGLAVGPFDGLPDPSVSYDAARAALGRIGYETPVGGHAAALLAFQRRFCPAALGQGFSPLTKAALIATAGAMADPILR